MYKDDLVSYRTNTNKQISHERNLNFISLSQLIFYVSAFFISRVIFINDIMPFGIAFFIAACIVLKPYEAFTVGIVTIAGTLSTSQGSNCVSHSIVILTMLLISYFLKNSKSKKVKMIIYAIIANIIVNIVLKAFYKTNSLVEYDYIYIILETSIIAGFGYIFSFGLYTCLDIKKRKAFSKEELTSICIGISLVICGMWEIKFYNISFKNMLSFFIVLVIGYMQGAASGAACGVSLGTIIGISSPNNIGYLGIYGLCGLIAGLFNDGGKLISSAGFLVSGSLISVYISQNTKTNNIFMDMLLPILIFLIVPEKKYEKVAAFMDSDKMNLKLQQSYIERIRDTIDRRMVGVSSSLCGLADVLEKNTENELSKKIEIKSMIENLADRACYTCEYRDKCWKDDFYITFNLFIELLREQEKNGKLSVDSIPEALKRKCIKPNELIRQANNIFEICRLNNSWKKKLINSKKIVAGQIKGISNLMGSMMSDISTSVDFKNDVEEEIVADLDKNGVEFNDVLAIKNNRNKYEVIVYRNPCSGKQLCSKEFPSIISKTLGVRMKRDENNCRFIKNASMCQFRLIEAENYDIITAVSKMGKEDVSGDNFTFGNINEGRYFIALSDGMGSGPVARAESNTTLSLLEKFIEAGFERNTVIKAINSVLVLRSSDECYATIDMALIDLYSGVGEFVKIGAAPSFIKSGKSVEVVRSSSLPVGILNDISIESDVINLKSGDMVITVSDGVVDSMKDKEKWLVSELQNYDNNNPKEMADYIIEAAKENYGQHIGDDMTVMVSKVIKIM